MLSAMPWGEPQQPFVLNGRRPDFGGTGGKKNFEGDLNFMKKAIFIIIALLLLATVAVALMARSSAPAASMGAIGVSDPGSAAKLVAGLKAKFTTGKAEIGRTLEAKK